MPCRKRKQMSGRLCKQLAFIEIYSGSATVSRVSEMKWFREFAGTHVMTVDWDASFNPTDVLDLPSQTDELIRRARERFPGMQFVIWASVPCEMYSINNTTGVRDLVAADARVRCVKVVGRELNALVTVIENPATGLLVGREVINFLPYTFRVDYCRYGFLYQKQTMLWCDHDLRQGGFEPRVCENGSRCTAYDRDIFSKAMGHPIKMDDLTPTQRIAVPAPLAAAVLSAIANIVPGLVDEPEETHRTTRQMRRFSRDAEHDSHLRYEVNYVSACHRNGGDVLLKIHWKGCDDVTWQRAADLGCDPLSLDYFSAALRDQAKRWLAAADTLEAPALEAAEETQPDAGVEDRAPEETARDESPRGLPAGSGALRVVGGFVVEQGSPAAEEASDDDVIIVNNGFVCTESLQESAGETNLSQSLLDMYRQFTTL